MSFSGGVEFCKLLFNETFFHVLITNWLFHGYYFYVSQLCSRQLYEGIVELVLRNEHEF